MMAADLPQIFQFANQLALLGWIWLILWLFLPHKFQHITRFGGLLLPLILAIMYASTALVHLGNASGGFDSLSNVMSLFKDDGATLAGWIHFLAFDLFVGWCITRHAISCGAHRLIIIPCLLLTFMLGPVGLLLYTCIHLAQCWIRSGHWHSSPASPLWKQVLGGQPTLARNGIVLLLFIPVLMLALVMDTRTTLDVNVWVKPLKFTAALAIYTLTLSWYTNHLPTNWRNSKLFNGFTLLVVVCIGLEMLWLLYAAAIGEPSHFNQSHPVLKPVYPLMGILATILTTQSLITGVGIFRNKTSALPELTRYSLAFGLVATFILTMITANYMAGAPAQSHMVLPQEAATLTDKSTLFLFGWMRGAGDLRVAHFFATHAMHFVPFAGWFIATFFSQRLGHNNNGALTFALILTVLYSCLVLLAFYQALIGKAFI
ncbi:MAG: ABA4-like family protein [Granulosicoccus sp.]